MYIVSCCLLGINCKYSGGNNRCENVIKFLENHEYIAVCPEKCGGLPTPRDPSEIVGEKVISRTGKDVTNEFISGAEMSLENALRMADEIGEEIEGAILKANSPSCGVGTIYDGTFTGKLITGNGIFAEKLIQKGFILKTEKEF